LAPKPTKPHAICFKQPKLFELHQNLYSVGQNVPSGAHVHLCVKNTSIVFFWWSEFPIENTFFVVDKLGNNKFSSSFNLSPNLFGKEYFGSIFYTLFAFTQPGQREFNYFEARIATAVNSI
jgi:hypothetical protein